MRIRVSPSLHIHFDRTAEEPSQRRLLVEHVRGGKRFELLTSAALRALDLAHDWIVVGDYLARLEDEGLDHNRAEAFLRDALANELLETDAAANLQRTDLRAQLLNVAGASLVHKLLLARSSQIFLDYSLPETQETEESLMQAYSSVENPPAVFRDYEHPIDVVPMAPDREQWLGPIEDTATLSRFLLAVFGATGVLQDSIQGTLLLKTHPSGGARHPVECYLGVRDLPGLTTGLYHYSVRHHALNLLTAGDQIVEVLHSSLFPDFVPIFTAVLTVIPERVMWRYREPTSIFVTMLDAGHALGNFALACESAGINYRINPDVDVRIIGDLMKSIPPGEFPVAAIGIAHA